MVESRLEEREDPTAELSSLDSTSIRNYIVYKTNEKPKDYQPLDLKANWTLFLPEIPKTVNIEESNTYKHLL